MNETINTNEIWKPILNYENEYEISNLGRVKSKARPCKGRQPVKEIYMKQQESRNTSQTGDSYYYVVDLYKNKKRKHMKVHRLIAEAFIPNPNNLPHINHINFNTLDNSLENLEWITPKGNSQHSLVHGRLRPPKLKGEDSPSSKLKESDVIFIRKNYTIKDIAKISKIYGMSRAGMYHVLKRECWKHVP